VRFTVVFAWFVALYVPLIRYAAPNDWRALMRRVAGLYRGKRGASEAVATTAAAA
jgi:hypothetical protein